MTNLALFLVLVMIAAIVGADFLFFRHDFRRRLMANAAIVIVFGIIYMMFGRHF